MVVGSGGGDGVEELEGILKKRKRRSSPTGGEAQAAQGDGAQGIVTQWGRTGGQGDRPEM